MNEILLCFNNERIHAKIDDNYIPNHISNWIGRVDHNKKVYYIYCTKHINPSAFDYVAVSSDAIQKLYDYKNERLQNLAERIFELVDPYERDDQEITPESIETAIKSDYIHIIEELLVMIENQ